MPLPFNKQLDLKLLSLVKENPILYNTKHLKYLDFDSREVVWQKIGDIMNRPAATFAGIQCQIHFGDFQEDKHKPGFIENLNEFLPKEYATAWGVEKKILREYKKQQGQSQLDAKVTYNKTARALPTYGVTFFLVKEKQKGKKKLVPRLLGINAESILRLDEVSKEILQVWPLTHVKTYHAGKGETFTLNFGDYSEKEYSVKSPHALRIRDILQGYIDLIRKRMEARYHHQGEDGMVICLDQVQAARGNVMEVVAHGASQPAQQSFVGPSRLLEREAGARPQPGAHMVTAQQALITELARKHCIAESSGQSQAQKAQESDAPPAQVYTAHKSSGQSPKHNAQESAAPSQLITAHKSVMDELAQQRAVKSSISMRGDMSKEAVRGLNKLNSSAVRVVSLLTTPTEASIKEAQKLVETMQQSIPAVIKGLKETIAMQEDEAQKKKLQEELQELTDLLKKLSSETAGEVDKPAEAVDTAMTIADLSMQMYFSLDPNNRRRSQQIEKSRASFRKSEKKEERLRRESFVAAASTALHAVETAHSDITHEYTGPPLDAKEIEELQKSSVDKIGKLSATVALYLTAHADPKNIDYAASVTSMNTIKELIPELANDIQALASTKSPADRKTLLEDIQGLCAATKRVCTLRDSDDHEKIQEASNDYADVSSKLIFTLGKGINADKRNEIIEIAKQVGDKASVVLLKTNELSTSVLAVDEAAASEVDDAGIRVAHAARDLLACAQLTAPAIHEPHCRSALMAAAESLSSSAQHLSNTWKPLVEEPGRQELGEQLHHRTVDLHKAIEKLKDSFDNLDDNDLTMMEVDGENDLSPQDRARLQFIFNNSHGKFVNNLQAAEQELKEPLTKDMTEASIAESQKRLDERLAALNAAVAALLGAIADRDKVDYAAVQREVDTISSLLPAVAKDAKSAGADESGRQALLQHTRALCDASRALCAAAGETQPEALHSAAAQFADATRKLRFVLPRTQDPAREQEIVSTAAAACGAASQVLGGVQQLGSRLGGPAGSELDARGARFADAAQALLASAQVAAGSVESPRCREELLAAADALAREGQQLQAVCRARADPADPLLQRILADHGQLQAELDKFRAAVDADRALLASSVAAAEDKLKAAERELDKPSTPLRGETVDQVQKRLDERLAALNAAVAALLGATADRDKVDYAAVQREVDTISSLLPAVAKDAKSAGADESGRQALLQHTRALCDASRALCAAAGETQPEALHSAAAQFADATRKLRFVLPRTQDPAREQEIVSTAAAACGAASQVLGGVQQLGSRLGGPAGSELDARGARFADAAQALLASAQVAAGSVESPRCREELLAAADALAREGQQLQAVCRARADPADPLLQRILADHGQLQAELDKFRAAVDADRALLASSVAAAEDKLKAAERELDKPSTPLRGETVDQVQKRLDERLAALNAAVAALLGATADRDKVDYAAVQREVDTISSLLPAVAKDAKSAGADESGRQALLQHTRALCDASRALCAAAGETQPEALHSAAAQFADATRKLRFVLPRTQDPAREQEIVSTAAAACGAASQVLGGVQQLGSRLGGPAGSELDARGARFADAAQALLASAQVAAGSVESPRCREELLAAADALAREGQQLQAVCRARADPADPLLQRILADHGQLQAELDKFRAAVDADRALLASSVAAAEDKLKAAERELDKPSTPLRGETVDQVQKRLDERLAALNAAVAALLGATADRDKVDYAAVQREVDTISSLLPAVAKDAKSAGADESGRQALLQHTRALCDASRALCAAAGETQPEALHSAAAQFADATRKLRFVLPRTQDPAREQEIVSTAAAACGAASQVLGGVQQLGSRLGGPAGSELDARGARFADAAQALLASAQVAAGSVESPRCREELLAAADALAREGQQLQAVCRARADPADPLLQRILADHGQLQAELDKFRAAVDADRALLASSVAAAEDKLKAAERELDKPSTPLRGETVDQVQKRLDERLAALNAAVAALLGATADRDKVDYAAVQREVDTISSLLPAVAKDAKSAGADESGRQALLQHTRALCDASRALCAAAGETQPEALHSAAAQFADATRKLRFVLPRTQDPAREQEIVSTAAAACGAASQVLGGVQQLGSRLGGPAGSELDARGARFADAAQALLASAQVAAGSVESPRCREELLAAADALAREGQQLQAVCRARADPADPLLQRILADHGQLQAELDKFRAAVDADRALLASSVAAAEDKLKAAERELDKPSTPLRGETVDQVQKRLDERLAALNAAVAALLGATADRDKVDYAAVQREVDTISSLLPAVAKDAKSAGADESGRQALLQHTRALCDASRALCAAAGETQPEALHSAAAQFADATRKLRFVLPRTQDPAREQEIVSTAAAACGAASQVLGGVQQLGSRLGGPAGSELDARGARFADAAQALLASAQVAAGSVESPRCREELLAAADALAREGQQLQAVCRARADPADPLLQRILADHGQLQAELDKFRAAVDADRALLASSVAAAEDKLKAAERELDKPSTPLRGETVDQVQKRLDERLAALNAAVAALLGATADRDKVDYAAVQREVDTISSLLPAVAKDAKSAGADESGRQALLQHTRALCDASRALCAAAGETQPEALHSAAAQFADATRKLRFVLPRTHDHAREQEVVACVGSACSAASHLAGSARELREGTARQSKTKGGPSDSTGSIQLQTREGRLTDAAKTLLETARLTAGSIDSPACRTALLKAAEQLACEGQEVQTACQAATDPADPVLRRVQSDNSQLQGEVNRLTGICLLPATEQPPSLPTKTRPPVPKRLSSLDETTRIVAHAQPRSESGDSSRDFLDHLRSHEEKDQIRAAERGLGNHEQFVASVNDACREIQTAEDSLRKASSTSPRPALDAGDVAAMQRGVQEKLALAGVEVANLVSANYADTIDYEAASKSTEKLPKLMTAIAEDAKSLSSVIHGDARKTFLDDMLGLCEASKMLCVTAEKNREKLNDAAIVFGDKSGKLLREVSTDIDPALEKEIISRAKAIGDSASRLALESAELASSAGNAGDATDGYTLQICKSGAECVDAAGKLIYTAKLVSPSIHNKTCQDTLVSSADSLTNKLRAFSETWKQAKANPAQATTVEKLSGEAENLEKLLENLKKDVKGELGKKRVEKLVVEDTPLRQITMKILEDAKRRAESTAVPAEERRQYAEYANRLADALRALDLDNSRCNRAPHDMEKHRALQNAIQNLQMVLLQTRPSRPDKDNSVIVDLKEFIKDVSSEADKLNEATSSIDVPRGKHTLEGIKGHCDQMDSEAQRFIDPSGSQPPVDADTLDGLLEVDHFGLNCGHHVADIHKLLDTLPQDSCTELRKQADVLDDSCSLLRFATKSAVSMAQGVAYEEAMCDLEDLQARVLASLVPPAGGTDAGQSGSAAAMLARAALTARPRRLAPALAAYSARLAPAHHQHRDRLLDHLNKLTDLLKSLVACSSKKIATWQPVQGPELSAITEQILQELDNPSILVEGALKPQESLVSPALVNKLLSPDEHVKMNADKKELDHKMQKLSSYLIWMCGSALPEESNPANLPTKLQDVVTSTTQLGSVARALKPRDDPVQSQRMEEAAQEMSYAAYGLLKTSELVRQDPKHPESRRKLLDACRSLTDTINKLNRVTPCKNKIKRECTEALSGLEAHQRTLREAGPPASLPFAACVDALNEHKEIVHKLKSEEKMSREEFMKNLNYISSAVCNSVEYAAHCNYLLSVSESDKGVAKDGLVDVPHIQRTAAAVQEMCVQAIRLDAEQANEEVPLLEKRVQDLVQALEQAQCKVKDKQLEVKVTKAKVKVDTEAKALCVAIRNRCQDVVAPLAMELISATNEVRAVIGSPAMVPQVGDVTADTKARCDEIRNNSQELLNKTQALIKEVSSSAKDDNEEDEMLTWTSFSHKKNVVDAFDKLYKSIKANGQKAGILEVDPSELEEAGEQKSYVQIQVDIANKWLLKNNCKPDVKVAGEEAAKNVIEVARKMSIDLKDNEKEDMVNLVTETEELLGECSKKYNHEKYCLLSERLKEMKKAVEQGVVTWIVEDFLEGEPPLADLETLIDSEKDKSKRELILERKIAELLAQLARVNKTANLVAHAGLVGPTHNKDLTKCREETELLAPLLVKAAQERIASADNNAIVENYKALLAKYTESLSKVRDLCDQAVDPTDFVQTAGETMQRLREESTDQDDLQKCDYASKAITGLAERVMSVSLSSHSARRDPELQRALAAAQRRLAAARAPPAARRSALPDWRHTAAEIMRTTGEVEAVLVGENIFEKQPEADQPIFKAARGLHAAVSEWRARDNGVVAGARRLAVLMARLSEHMRDEKKHDLILTSKSIVLESHEVAQLARKLAHECTDLRIKNNLLQTCERIPTISGQLKMLTTVKGSSLGHQGSEDDKEAMDMLVGNAQNLMMSIQEVVKAAASASVKIASQRGPRMRWVRKTYY